MKWLLAAAAAIISFSASAAEVIQSREFESGKVSLVRMVDQRCETGYLTEVVFKAGFLPEEYGYFEKIMNSYEAQPCKEVAMVDATDETKGFVRTGKEFGTLVRVTSKGGYAKYGVKMAARINSVDGQIFVDGDCLSTCAIAFFGTFIRSISPEGKIGVHAPYFPREWTKGSLSKWECLVYDDKDTIVRSMKAGIADEFLSALIVETKFNECNPQGFRYFTSDTIKALGLSI